MGLLFTFSRPPVALSAATISKMPLQPTRASKAAAAYVTVTISALREVSEAMQFVLAAYADSEQWVYGFSGIFEIVAVAKAGGCRVAQPSTEGDRSEGPYWLRIGDGMFANQEADKVSQSA